jgi:putative endonuclease
MSAPPGGSPGARRLRHTRSSPAAEGAQRTQKPDAVLRGPQPRHPGGDPAPRRPRTARGALGRYGEDLAARSLTASGLTVLACNWRAGRSGEIDIVARDGDTLVICEVKTRRAGVFQHPMAAVTPAKAQRLRGLAERWLQEHGGAPPGGVRIDLVGVLLPTRGAPRVEHVRGVA